MEIADLIVVRGKIKFYEYRVKKFNIINNKFEAGILPKTEYWNFLLAIEDVVNCFYRYLKKYYKLFYGITLKTPLLAYKQEKAEGFIENADCWIEYISDLNALLNISREDRENGMLYKFLDYYRRKIPLIFDRINSDENKKIIEQAEPYIKDYMVGSLKLSKNKPIYSNEELGIPQESYVILLDFFKSIPSIKNVWLHGSRLYGNSNAYSDIDLLIDCPISEMDKINKLSEKLDVPHFCDFANINDKENMFFIKTVTERGTKKIYCADDFNIYWGAEQKKDEIKTEVNISNIVAEPIDQKKSFYTWQEYYNNTWKQSYEAFINNFEEAYSEEAFQRFFDLYENTYTLMRTYLSNNGLFLDGMWLTVKYAYRVYLIDDGDSWIEIVDQMYRYSGESQNKINIYESFVIKKFKLFTDLNEKLIKLMEKNEKTTC